MLSYFDKSYLFEDMTVIHEEITAQINFALNIADKPKYAKALKFNRQLTVNPII